MFPSFPAMVVVALMIPAAGAFADWTEFRGPGGQGHASSMDLPVTWNGTENVRWKTPIAGDGWSSPVVKQGRVYLTTAAGNGDSKDRTLQLWILDAETGHLLRAVDVFEQDGESAPDIHDKNSHASPTPILEDDRVYVHFGHQGTACLKNDGTILWRNDSIDYAPVHGNGGSPIIVDGKLIFSCDGKSDPFIIALDKSTGQELWRTPRESDASKNFSFSTPLRIDVNGQTQIISPGSNCVCAYSPSDGREIWRVNYDGYSVVPRPVYGNGLIFISTGFNTPSVLAIRPDGEGDVTDTHVTWSSRRGAPHTPSMLLFDGQLYLISDKGVASCLDAETGEEIWRKRLGGNHSSSPLVSDGRIYCQSEEGVGIVIAAGTQFQELARNELEERSLASPAAADGALFIRTTKHLYRIQRSRSR